MDKKLHTLFIFLILPLMIPTVNAQEKLTEIRGFGSNPGELKMFLHVPDGINKSKPLVVVLHGCIQTAEQMAYISGWNTLADKYKFTVLYPQQQASNNPNKCFNWFLSDDITKNSGETASIKQMIDYTVENCNIDSTEVFITGLSAGGAMTSALLALYPETFKAGAIISGIPFGAATDLVSGLNAMQGKITKTAEEWKDVIISQHPNYLGKYPSIVIFHGVDDPAVNIINAKEITEQWASIHNIDTIAVDSKKFGKNNDITAYYYGKNIDDAQIIRYDINNLGHALAIDPGTDEKQGGNISPFAIDKDFYTTYWTADFFGLIEK